MAELVASLGSNRREDVGTNIPAAKGREVPVGLDGGELRVVVVEVVVVLANVLAGESISEKNGQDVVLDAVGLVLVEGDENQSVLHKVLVFEERVHESLEPVTSNGDGAVVSIRGHVGGDEHPLGELVSLEILVELRGGLVDHGKVLDLERRCSDPALALKMTGGLCLRT